jgi:hypothetical protein
MRPARVEVHIEELRLHGFSPCDRRGISESFARQLADLLAERGVPSPLAQVGTTERHDAGVFVITPGSRAEAIGAEIARTILGIS